VLVSEHGDGCSRRPSPAAVSRRVHPPSCRLLFGVPSIALPPFPLGRGSTYLGFLPSSRRHSERLPLRGFQASLSSVLRFSQPHDGLLRSGLCGPTSSRFGIRFACPPCGGFSCCGSQLCGGRPFLASPCGFVRFGSPWHPVPCGDPGTWGGRWCCLILSDLALPLPCLPEFC
jgi:hypothetical protein